MKKIELPVEKTHQMRSIRSELNVLTRSDGSAMLCQGDTVVMAAVYGPVEVKLQKMLIEKATIEAIYKPKGGHSGIGDRSRESFIRNACETALLATLHPKSAITIVLQEMQDNGGLLSCAVNAACLALLDAGLPMQFPVAAVTCALSETADDSALTLDPDSDVIVSASATFTFVFAGVTERPVVASYTTGTFDDGRYTEALDVCRNASDVVFAHYRSVVTKRISIINDLVSCAHTAED